MKKTALLSLLFFAIPAFGIPVALFDPGLPSDMAGNVIDNDSAVDTLTIPYSFTDAGSGETVTFDLFVSFDWAPISASTGLVGEFSITATNSRLGVNTQETVGLFDGDDTGGLDRIELD